MINLVQSIKNLEGKLAIVQDDQNDGTISIQAASNIKIAEQLINRNPLEAVQLVQHFSAQTGLFHALAATQALERYLVVDSNITALLIRKMMLNLAMISDHLSHFYYRIIPDFLNKQHYNQQNNHSLFPAFYKLDIDEYDLSISFGKEILAHLEKIEAILIDIHFILGSLGGKYPVVMNLIPGGITNTNLDHRLLIELIQRIARINTNVQEHFQMVREFIGQVSYYKKLDNQVDQYLSLGSESIAHNFKINDIILPEGFLQKTSIQPVNFNLIHKKKHPNNDTEINALSSNFYDDSIVSTGALARLLIAEKSGVLPSAAQNLQQILSTLYVDKAQINSPAGRLLAATFEIQNALSESLEIVQNIQILKSYNTRKQFDYKDYKETYGFIEGATGTIVHRAIIENNTILNYQIISGSSWQIAAQSPENNNAIIIQALNAKERFSELELNRIIHSFNISALEAMQ